MKSSAAAAASGTPPPPCREPVPGGDEQVDPLLGQPARVHVGARWQRRRQAQVNLAVPQPREHPLAAALHEREADRRVRRAEVPQQPRHDLNAQGVQEAECDPAARRVRLARQALK